MSRRARKGPQGSAEEGSALDRLMGPVEAARFLRVSLSSIQRWIDSGAIPAHRTLGGHRRILEKHLVDFAGREGIPISPPATSFAVLVVDDEEDVVESLVTRIRGLRPDIEVLSAVNGFDAGGLIQKHRPALVLLDIRMPGVNGIDVCRSIKENPETRATRVVGVTATTRHTEIEALYEAGAEDVLIKPLRREAVEEILDRCVPKEEPAPSRGPSAARRVAART